MTTGIILILIGLLLMCVGVWRLWNLQGPARDDTAEADWFDDSPDTGSGDSSFPYLSFIATVIGALLGGAILVVFGIVQCLWS